MPAKNLAAMNCQEDAGQLTSIHTTSIGLTHHRCIGRPGQPCSAEQREEGAVYYTRLAPISIHDKTGNHDTDDSTGLENSGEGANDLVAIRSRLASLRIHEVHISHERRLTEPSIRVVSSARNISSGYGKTHVTPMIEAGYPNAICPIETRKLIQKVRQLYCSREDDESAMLVVLTRMCEG